MFPRLSSSSSSSSFSSSSSSLVFVCERCAKPILPKQSLLTVSERFFHRHCFFCSQKQCGRTLSLAEFGVHQNEIFCANCFVALFSVQRDAFICHQPKKSSSECNGNATRNKREEKAIEAQNYERQLRTVQLGEEEGHGGAQQTHSGCSSAWPDCVGPALLTLSTGERRDRRSPSFGRSECFGHLIASPIPEAEEDTESAASSATCSPRPQAPASPPAAVLRCVTPRVPLGSAHRSVFSSQRPSVCKRCTQCVFEAEKLIAAGEVWHKRCFRCLRCGRSLEPGKFSDRDGEIFCNNCYAKQFGPKGVGCGIGAGILQMHQ